jgi:hypothetical protein
MMDEKLNERQAQLNPYLQCINPGERNFCGLLSEAISLEQVACIRPIGNTGVSWSNTHTSMLDISVCTARLT